MVVDPDPSAPARQISPSTEDLEFVEGDGVEFTLSHLRDLKPDLVIPTIPRHLAGALVKGRLEGRGLVVEGEGGIRALKVLERLPLEVNRRLDVEREVAILSYMPFESRCREGCIPPRGFCPPSKIKRPQDLHVLLEGAFEGLFDAHRVLVSRQLGAGFGGFLGEDLAGLLGWADGLSVGGVAVGTACTCHGVANFFRVRQT